MRTESLTLQPTDTGAIVLEFKKKVSDLNEKNY